MSFCKTLLEKWSIKRIDLEKDQSSFCSDWPTAHLQVSPFHRALGMHRIPGKFSWWDWPFLPDCREYCCCQLWPGIILLCTWAATCTRVCQGWAEGLWTFWSFFPEILFPESLLFIFFKEETVFYWDNLTPFSLELKLLTAPFTRPWMTGNCLKASSSLGPMRNHKNGLNIFWLILLPSWSNSCNAVEVHDIKGDKKLSSCCQFYFCTFCWVGLEGILWILYNFVTEGSKHAVALSALQNLLFFWDIIIWWCSPS